MAVRAKARKHGADLVFQVTLLTVALAFCGRQPATSVADDDIREQFTTGADDWIGGQQRGDYSNDDSSYFFWDPKVRALRIHQPSKLIDGDDHYVCRKIDYSGGSFTLEFDFFAELQGYDVDLAFGLSSRPGDAWWPSLDESFARVSHGHADPGKGFAFESNRTKEDAEHYAKSHYSSEGHWAHHTFLYDHDAEQVRYYVSTGKGPSTGFLFDTGNVPCDFLDTMSYLVVSGNRGHNYPSAGAPTHATGYLDNVRFVDGRIEPATTTQPSSSSSLPPPSLQEFERWQGGRALGDYPAHDEPYFAFDPLMLALHGKLPNRSIDGADHHISRRIAVKSRSFTLSYELYIDKLPAGSSIRFGLTDSVKGAWSESRTGRPHLSIGYSGSGTEQVVRIDGRTKSGSTISESKVANLTRRWLKHTLECHADGRVRITVRDASAVEPSEALIELESTLPGIAKDFQFLLLGVDGLHQPSSEQRVYADFFLDNVELQYSP